MTRFTRTLTSVAYAAFLIYVFLPMLLVVIMSFKDSRFTGFPINSWTLAWYPEVFQNVEIVTALGYSTVIAITSTVAALFIGTWISLLLSGKKFVGRTIIFGLTILPTLIPGIISAVAFRIYAKILGIEPGMFAIIWAHTIHNIPFVVLVLVGRLSTLPKNYGEAACDLGADPLVTFFRITVPYLRPALLGAGIFCLLVSFDDFIRSFFLGGYQPTLPVYIFTKLKSGMSPEINAISTIVLVMTAVVGIWAERFMRRMKKGSV